MEYKLHAASAPAKLFLGALVFLTGLTPVFPQRAVDSLLALVRQAPSDTVRIDRLIDLGRICTDEHRYPLAVRYHQQAIRMARVLGDSLRETTAWYFLGHTIDNQGDDRAAIQIYEQVVPKMKRLGNRRREAAAALKLSSLYYFTRNLYRSNYWANYTLALRDALLPGHPQLVFLAYFYPGQNYRYLSKLDSSQHYLSLALDLCKQYPIREKSLAVGMIAENYLSLGRYEQAKDMIQSVIEQARAQKDHYAEMYGFTNLGQLHQQLYNLPAARSAYQEAIKLGESLHIVNETLDARLGLLTCEQEQTEPADYLRRLYNLLDTMQQHVPEDVAKIYPHIARALFEAGQANQALNMLDQGIQNAQKYENNASLIENLTMKGEFLLKKRDVSGALPVLKRAWQCSRDWQPASHLARCQFLLGQAEIANGKLQAGLPHLQDAWAFQDSSNRQKASAIATVTAALANAENQSRLLEARQKALIAGNRLNQMIYWAAFFSLLSLAVILYLQVKRRRLQVRQTKLLREIAEQLAQLNPQMSTQSFDYTPENLIETARSTIADFQETVRRQTETLRAFNYTVSHDLKAPLANAERFLDLLQAGAATNANTQEDGGLGVFRSLLADMKKMIEGIGAYAQADNLALEKEMIDTNSMVEQVVQQVRLQHPNHTATITVGALPQCYGDPLMLRQVFTNLLDNALKFTRYTPQALITVEGSRLSNAVEICVADNGAGIRPENAPQLFRLFRSAHERSRFEGSGIGLSIVKRIAERHGGAISAHSNGENRGTRFTLTLPL